MDDIIAQEYPRFQHIPKWITGRDFLRFSLAHRPTRSSLTPDYTPALPTDYPKGLTMWVH
jgi:hypothetical protein